MLQILENNEVLKMIVNDTNDIDIINFLFPNSIIEIDVCGENLIAIVKADNVI